MLLQVIIFVTGGAILALELLASRIMTPYFGVSLYIWSGILSITLVSLALGYWAGGKLAGGKKGRAPQPEKLAFLFTLMPALAALAIVAACLVYPYLFYQLARLDLVLGAFSACLILLCVPLLATSAMNPLLVAIRLRQTAARGELADAGAGRVFFVSTIGSVAGVLVTAFGLIPYLSNFASTLLVAAILAALPLILLFGTSVRIAGRKPLAATAAAALAAALGSARRRRCLYRPHVAGKLRRHDVAARGELPLAVRHHQGIEKRAARKRALPAHLLSGRPDPEHGRFGQPIDVALHLCARSAVALPTGPGCARRWRSASAPAWCRCGLPAAASTSPPSISIPLRCARRPRCSASIPARYARSKPTRAPSCAHATTATTVVIVDLFHGDGVPDYLITRDFFHDLKRCLGPDGIAVFNTFADLDYPRAYAHFLTTLRTELPFIVLYRPDYGLSPRTSTASSSPAASRCRRPPASI